MSQIEHEINSRCMELIKDRFLKIENIKYYPNISNDGRSEEDIKLSEQFQTDLNNGVLEYGKGYQYFEKNYDSYTGVFTRTAIWQFTSCNRTESLYDLLTVNKMSFFEKSKYTDNSVKTNGTLNLYFTYDHLSNYVEICNVEPSFYKYIRTQWLSLRSKM